MAPRAETLIIARRVAAADPTALRAGAVRAHAIAARGLGPARGAQLIPATRSTSAPSGKTPQRKRWAIRKSEYIELRL